MVKDKKENYDEEVNEDNILDDYTSYLEKHITIGKIYPRSMLKLDENMAEALKKMNQVREIVHKLPMVDCGSCGAPNCQAFAQDIVQGNATIEDCYFVQKNLETSGLQSSEDSLKKLIGIWGKEKFGINYHDI